MGKWGGGGASEGGLLHISVTSPMNIFKPFIRTEVDLERREKRAFVYFLSSWSFLEGLSD